MKVSKKIFFQFSGLICLMVMLGPGKVSAATYSCSPVACQPCYRACAAPVPWDGSGYNVPAGAYAIINKCRNVDLISQGRACACLPTSHITNPWGVGYDTCDLPDVERYFVRGPTRAGWDPQFCGTQQVDVNNGLINVYHSVANLDPVICNPPVIPEFSLPTLTVSAVAGLVIFLTLKFFTPGKQISRSLTAQRPRG